MEGIRIDLEHAARGFMQACIDRDPDRIASFFDDSAVAMYPRPLPTIGREANWQAWASALEAPDATHPISVDEVCTSANNDLGYSFGRWWLIRPSSSTYVGGRYVAIWRPVHGEWLIQRLAAIVHDDISATRPETNS